MTQEFDPLDYANLTRHVVEELMRQPVVPIGSLARFDGAGVYALFYRGELDFYAGVRSEDSTTPIYVGKAVPPGGRKGQLTTIDQPALFNRLFDHRKSIEAAQNLAPDDFLCRYLVVKPLWIVMAERFLITHYQPVWNACIDGFGNHDPGRRREGRRSRWDTLHPGRVETWSRSREPVVALAGRPDAPALQATTTPEAAPRPQETRHRGDAIEGPEGARPDGAARPLGVSAKGPTPVRRSGPQRPAVRWLPGEARRVSCAKGSVSPERQTLSSRHRAPARCPAAMRDRRLDG